MSLRVWSALAVFVMACSHPSPRPIEVADRKPIAADAPVAPDAAPIPDAAAPVEAHPATTVTTYTFEPASRIPGVGVVAAYKPLGTPRVVRIAVNTWTGWAPLLWANQGGKPKKIWKDAKGGDFQLELVLVDNPIAMRDLFVGGTIHIGWAPVDMLPLWIASGLGKDPRTMPRVFQQIDWSHGSDGIVVRAAIKNVADLRGKTVVLAQNSSSHYFFLSLLRTAGVSPDELQWKFTRDPFQAAAAFNADKSISAAVTWAPDTHTLAAAKTDHLLVDTTLATRLIADVWFARADFAKDNPAIIEGIVRGIFDAVDELADPSRYPAAGALMDDFYGLPKGTGTSMLPDAHWTNVAENRAFFLDRDNATSFDRTFAQAAARYKAIRQVDGTIAATGIVDASILKRLAADPKYGTSKSSYDVAFTPTRAADANLEGAIVTKTASINFFPNSSDLHKKVPGPKGGETFYDPNVDTTVEEVAELAGQFGAARILIGGHTDASMKNIADETLVKELSLRRATAVAQEVVRRFNLPPAQLVVAGFGWDKPADPKDPDNHAKNRRIEISVLPAP